MQMGMAEVFVGWKSMGLQVESYGVLSPFITQTVGCLAQITQCMVALCKKTFYRQITSIPVGTHDSSFHFYMQRYFEFVDCAYR